jgi:hypothetical protein
MEAVNRISLVFLLALASWKSDLQEMVRNRQVQFDAWYTVLLAVLLTLAFTIYAGLMIWCVVYKGGTFTGNWEWSLTGVSVRAECV